MELTASSTKTKLERAKTFDFLVSQGDDGEYMGEVIERGGGFSSSTHTHIIDDRLVCEAYSVARILQ